MRRRRRFSRLYSGLMRGCNITNSTNMCWASNNYQPSSVATIVRLEMYERVYSLDLIKKSYCKRLTAAAVSFRH
jgi:hypothetical protein